MGDAQNQSSDFAALKRILSFLEKAQDTSSLEKEQEPQKSILISSLEKDESERLELLEKLQKTEERIAGTKSSLHKLAIDFEDKKELNASKALQEASQRLRPYSLILTTPPHSVGQDESQRVPILRHPSTAPPDPSPSCILPKRNSPGEVDNSGPNKRRRVSPQGSRGRPSGTHFNKSNNGQPFHNSRGPAQERPGRTDQTQPSQDIDIGRRHVQSHPDRFTGTASANEDDWESSDSTLTVERDAIYRQCGFIAGGSSDWESTYDLEPTDYGTDHPASEATADKTSDDRLQPTEPAESDLQDNWFESVSTEQHEITVSSSRENTGHVPSAKIQDTGISVTQFEQDQVIDLDDDEVTECATPEDDQITVSGWPSQTPSGDDDEDAHNKQVAVDHGYIPRDQIIEAPVIGQVYQCLWNDGDSRVENLVWYFVTRLPFADFSEIGISGHLAASQLCDEDNFPSCCRRPTHDQGPVTWAPGFEDGMPGVKRRRIPCLFLQKGLDIPSPAEEFVLPPDSPFLAWVKVNKLLPEDHPHEYGQGSTGLVEGAAVVNAFKSRLASIQASKAVDSRPNDPSNLPSPTSASAVVDTGAKPAGDPRSNDLTSASNRPGYPADPRQFAVSLGTPEPSTPIPGVDLEQAATSATQTSGESQSSNMNDRDSTRATHHSDTVEEHLATVGQNAEPVPALYEDTHGPQLGSALAEGEGEGQSTFNGRESGTPRNPQDPQPRKGPSAKSKISVEEWQRSRRPSLQSLRHPPRPLTPDPSTPPDPEWNSPEPQYDRFGVQIFRQDEGSDVLGVRS